MKTPSSSHDASAHSNSPEEIGDTYISSRRSSGTNSFFEEREGTATVLGACNNYINLTVGGGVVAIPKASKYTTLLLFFHFIFPFNEEKK